MGRSRLSNPAQSRRNNLGDRYLSKDGEDRGGWTLEKPINVGDDPLLRRLRALRLQEMVRERDREALECLQDQRRG